MHRDHCNNFEAPVLYIGRREAVEGNDDESVRACAFSYLRGNILTHITARAFGEERTWRTGVPRIFSNS